MKQSLRPKVLVVRMSAIGDIVLTTPVVRALKLQAQAEVHYLVKERYMDAIASNKYVDQIHTISGMQPLSRLLKRLQNLHFDWIIDLHHNLRSFMIKQQLGVRSAAFPKLNIEKWLMVNFKVDRLPDVHLVQRYMQTVQKLGIRYDGMGLDFTIPEKSLGIRSEVRDRLGHQRWICIAIGAGLPTKCLENSQLSRLVGLIDCPVLLLGGAEDREPGDTMEHQHAHVFNYAGRLDLYQSAALIQEGSLLITPDTGLMHIAAALDKPVIAYWGNTVPRFGMTPFYAEGSLAKQIFFENHNLPCRPCSKIGYQKCPKRHFKCIRELDISAMALTANSWHAG